jgi:glycosyltransferase involved in cell wall biosynthesis
MRRPATAASRVLIVSQPTTEGVAVCVRELVRGAVADGYEVTVACPSAGLLAGWACEHGARWVPLEMRRSPHASDMAAVARIRELSRDQALVHLHSSKAGALGRLALASLGRRRPPSVFTPHGWSWLVGGRLGPAYQIIERALAPVTSAVQAVSEEERACGHAVLGQRPGRFLVNPNGVDPSRFQPDGPVAARTDDPLVVSVGRLCRQRAPDIAVAALAIMRTASVRLRLVGDGEDRNAIERQVVALGLGDRVELAGYCPDTAPDLRAADVVVIPSRYDGMALVMLEAMACGAAIVATRVSGSSCLGDAGLLVPAEDPRSLAVAVDDLLAAPAERRRLGAAARDRAVQHYSLQHSVDRTLGLWRELGAAPAVDSSQTDLTAKVPPARREPWQQPANHTTR